MARLGARLIKDFERSNINAETRRLEARADESTLVSAIQTVELAFKKALRITLEWAGSDGEISLKLNRDFVESRLAAEELTALVKSWQAGALSREALHAQLQRGEILDADRTLEQEKAALEADPTPMPAPVQPAAVTPPGDEDDLEETPQT